MCKNLYHIRRRTKRLLGIGHWTKDIYNNVRGTRPIVKLENPGPFTPTPRRVARVVTKNIGVVNEDPL